MLLHKPTGHFDEEIGHQTPYILSRRIDSALLAIEPLSTKQICRADQIILYLNIRLLFSSAHHLPRRITPLIFKFSWYLHTPNLQVVSTIAPHPPQATLPIVNLQLMVLLWLDLPPHVPLSRTHPHPMVHQRHLFHPSPPPLPEEPSYLCIIYKLITL